jgi:hypothetical protein
MRMHVPTNIQLAGTEQKIFHSLIKSKIWNDEKKVKKINRLFDQIEALLEENQVEAINWFFHG